MKKYLLLASVVVFAISANAQDKSRAVYHDPTNMGKIDQESNNAPIKVKGIPNEKAASTIAIGTSYNAFTILGDRQNQVVYNPAINTVAFSHRQNDQAAGGSGIISWDYSTDGGANWTINPFQTTPNMDGGTSNGNRYPNMAIYNPSGNTNFANAYLVEVGPSLANTTVGDNGWAKTFRASAKFDGSNLDETYMNNSTIGTNNDPNEWGASGLYVNALGEAWYSSTNWNNQGAAGSEDPNFDIPGLYHDYFINRGVFNVGNNNFDWTTPVTVTPTWYSSDGGAGGARANTAGLMNMAWSPNGMVGYMVMMGADSNGTGNSMYRPYVMKTTNGGANWSRYPDFDFSTDPVLQTYVQPLNTNPALQRPFFSSYDMVVDINGDLRIFGEIASGYSDHPDSLGFTFAARQFGQLFEVATNSSNTYDVTFIDSILVDDHVWDLSTSGLSHFVRPQAARSQDGSKVFYTWIGSDASISIEREFPSVWAIANDITGGLGWSMIKNLSTGNNSDFVSAYQTMAVDAIENGLDEQWELAIVYGTAIGGGSMSDALTGSQWNYLRGVGFTAPTDWVVSVEENSLSENDVTLYPNPTNGVVDILITNVKEFDYNIIDIVGNVVATQHINGNRTTINLTTNAKGVYFVTIDTENGSITKKVMLTK